MRRGGRPSTSSVTATFSYTLHDGTSLKSWKTMPRLRRRNGTASLAQARDVAAEEEDAPVVDRLGAVEEAQEGRLARAARAGDEDELAALDGEAHPAEDGRAVLGTTCRRPRRRGWGAARPRARSASPRAAWGGIAPGSHLGPFAPSRIRGGRRRPSFRQARPLRSARWPARRARGRAPRRLPRQSRGEMSRRARRRGRPPARRAARRAAAARRRGRLPSGRCARGDAPRRSPR